MPSQKYQSSETNHDKLIFYKYKNTLFNYRIHYFSNYFFHIFLMRSSIPPTDVLNSRIKLSCQLIERFLKTKLDNITVEQ